MIVLSANSERWLNIQGALQRLEREIDSSEPRTSGCQTVMDMSGLGFSLKSALKHFLGGDKISAVKFNYTTVVKRVSIARQHALVTHTGFGDAQVGAGASGNF